MTLQEIVSHPLAIGAVAGFGLGMVLFVFALVLRWNKSSEFNRFRHMVNDKMKLEADHQELARAERARLSDENKNLKLKVSQLQATPEKSAAQDLEMMARAERHLLMSAPSFTSAWEQAKRAARAELEQESAGLAKPHSRFRRIFSSNGQPAAS
jgi:hypothetical protein